MPKWLVYVLLAVAGWLLIFKGKLPAVGVAPSVSPQRAPPAPSTQTAIVQTTGQLLGHLVDGVFRSTGGGTYPGGAPVEQPTEQQLSEWTGVTF